MTQEPDGSDPKGTPVCMKCLSPFTALDHYCRQCGAAVGQFTPYIPFVNIPFNYSFVGPSWKRLWSTDTGAAKRLGYFLLIVFMAPVALLGLPFVLWGRRKK